MEPCGALPCKCLFIYLNSCPNRMQSRRCAEVVRNPENPLVSAPQKSRFVSVLSDHLFETVEWANLLDILRPIAYPDRVTKRESKVFTRMVRLSFRASDMNGHSPPEWGLSRSNPRNSSILIFQCGFNQIKRLENLAWSHFDPIRG
jgi:hypothetical protein